MDRDDLNHSRNEEGALWSIVGYLLSGLIIWGGIGWGFDQWLGTNYFLLIGMLLGAGASIYLVWLRFGRD
jgi:F0F1-type ATP synthase assembly protein I